MGLSDFNLPNTFKLGLVPKDDKINIADNITFLLTGIKISSTLNPPTESSIIEKSDSGNTNNYWRKQDSIILLDV